MGGDMVAGGEPTRPDERLLNLVIALVNTSAAMTKQQVRASVHGYDAAPSTEAFERMFERDKETLRSLGVPIVTVEGSGHSDDVGYRIDNDAYALGPVDLSPAELGVVALAAQLWSDKTLRTDMSRAMTKLAAAGASASAAQDAVAGLAPRVRAAGDAYGPLLEAISQRRPVSFRYRAASTGEVRTRQVEPWRIAARGGGWYVIGHDRDRGAVRIFRLSRIVGRVRLGQPAGAFDLPDQVDVDAALGAGVGTERLAVLAVAPERAPALRARAVGDDDVTGDVVVPAGRDRVTVTFRSRTTFAEELAGYGAAVVVLAPQDLRAEVVRRLGAAARLAPGAGEDADGRTR